MSLTEANQMTLGDPIIMTSAMGRDQPARWIGHINRVRRGRTTVYRAVVEVNGVKFMKPISSLRRVEG